MQLPDRAGAGDLDLVAAAGLWERYVAHRPRFADASPPPSERFGDSAAMADQLLALVLTGVKRATAALVAEFESEREPLPRVGGHWIVHDAAGAPCAVLRSLELRVGPLGSVDEAFAWDEGEGDRSLAYWRRAHDEFFHRSCRRLGVLFGDDVEVVFERFRVVWPLEHADR